MLTAVYDENTYRATEGEHPAVNYEVILPAEGLHSDEHGVEALLSRLPSDTTLLLAIGAGTVHDITRYCAYLKGIDFVSCPTAASVDGFCSSVAAMTWEGCKKTLTAVAPRLVIADLDVIASAPSYLAKSGFGDIIGKYIALADWKIAHLLTGEFYCETIANMMMEATRAVEECAKALSTHSVAAYESLTAALLLSGIAMQLLGNSRPASGAEHHISHLIETAPTVCGISSTALHGEKVGVATILAATEYHRLIDGDVSFGDYPAVTAEEIYAVFGKEIGRGIEDENKHDCAAGIRGEQIQAARSEIAEIVADIPTAETLYRLYATVGAKSRLGDIGIPEEKIAFLLHHSPLVRNRLTLMRLARGTR